MNYKEIKICLHLVTNDNEHIYKYFVDKKQNNDSYKDVKERLENKIQLWLNCNGHKFKAYCYCESDLFDDNWKPVIIDVPVISEE